MPGLRPEVYASYLRENDDIALSGLTASSVNEFFEVCIGGLVMLPAAFVFLGPVGLKEFSGSVFGLAFQALPNVFALMPAGRVFGALWFLMLFIAAVTSSVSMLQPVIAFLEEGFDLKRHASVTLLGLLCALGCGFVQFFSKDQVALDVIDFWVGSVLIFLLAAVQSVLYGWLFGIARGDAELHRGAHLRVPRFVQWLLKYVAPTYLFTILVTFCVQNVPAHVRKISQNPVALAAILFVAILLGFVLILVHIAGKRWAAEGRFDNLKR